MTDQLQRDLLGHDGGMLAILGVGVGLVTLLMNKNLLGAPPSTHIATHLPMRITQLAAPSSTAMASAAARAVSPIPTTDTLLHYINIDPVAYDICHGDLRCHLTEDSPTCFANYSSSQASPLKHFKMSASRSDTFSFTTSHTSGNVSSISSVHDLEAFVAKALRKILSGIIHLWPGALGYTIISHLSSALSLAVATIMFTAIALTVLCLMVFALLRLHRLIRVEIAEPIEMWNSTTPLPSLKNKPDKELEEKLAKKLKGLETKLMAKVKYEVDAQVHPKYEQMEERIGEVMSRQTVDKTEPDPFDKWEERIRRLERTTASRHHAHQSGLAVLQADLTSTQELIVSQAPQNFPPTHSFDAQEVHRLAGLVNDLTETVASLKSDLEKAQSEVAGTSKLQEKVDGVNSMLKAVRSQLEDTMQQGHRDGVEIEKTSAILSDLKQSHKTLDAKVDKIKDDLAVPRPEGGQPNDGPKPDSKDDDDRNDNKGNGSEDDDDKENRDDKPPAAPPVAVAAPNTETRAPAKDVPSSSPADPTPTKQEPPMETAPGTSLEMEQEQQLVVEVPQGAALSVDEPVRAVGDETPESQEPCGEGLCLVPTLPESSSPSDIPDDKLTTGHGEVVAGGNDSEMLDSGRDDDTASFGSAMDAEESPVSMDLTLPETIEPSDGADTEMVESKDDRDADMSEDKDDSSDEEMELDDPRRHKTEYLDNLPDVGEDEGDDYLRTAGFDPDTDFTPKQTTKSARDRLPDEPLRKRSRDNDELTSPPSALVVHQPSTSGTPPSRDTTAAGSQSLSINGQMQQITAPETPARVAPRLLPKTTPSSKSSISFLSLIDGINRSGATPKFAFERSDRTPPMSQRTPAAASLQAPSSAPRALPGTQSYLPHSQQVSAYTSPCATQQPAGHALANIQAREAESGQLQQLQRDPISSPNSHLTCYCGRVKANSSTGNFSCGETCPRHFPCKHRCDRACHEGDCGECKRRYPAACRTPKKK